MIDLPETVKKNQKSLDDYRNLLLTLSDEQLTAPMPGGWTISALLCHLAFWDQRALVLLEKWEKNGIEFAPNDVDVVNDATLPLFLAIPGRAAVNIFLQTAELIDRKVATLDKAWAEEAVTKGKTIKLDRAHHRSMHLDEIKTVLGKG